MSSTNNAASDETNNVRNVRQRANPIGLESLPDDTLLRVATFLSHTTRALLSVALTAPSTSYDLGGHNENEKDIMAKKIKELTKESGWEPANDDSLSDVLSYAIAAGHLKKINNNPQHQKLSKASKIVLSNPYYYESNSFDWGSQRYQNKEDWKTLDLLDLDKSLRMRLTDGDIAGILVCIDAVNNLEEIKLPHCMNIRGDGLSSLKGSVVLKRADLCVVSEEVDSMTPKLSIDAVLPILDSIMAKNQNSMSRLHIPKVWRDTYSERLNNFYLENQVLPNATGYRHMSQSDKRARYLINHPNWNHMIKRKMDCSECFSDFRNHSGKIYTTCEGGDKIVACPEPGCGKKYCSDDADYQIKKCNVCEKRKCDACDLDLFECYGCDRILCSNCTERFICNACGDRDNCLDCAVDGSGLTRTCGGCNVDLCRYCDPDMTHMGTGEHACEVCRGVDEADQHGPDNPAQID